MPLDDILAIFGDGSAPKPQSRAERGLPEPTTNRPQIVLTRPPEPKPIEHTVPPGDGAGPVYSAVPPDDKPPQTSTGQALGLGLESGLTFDFADELRGVRAAGPSWMPDMIGTIPARHAAGLMRLGYETLGKQLGLVDDTSATDAYTQTRDADREVRKTAQQEHPFAYTAGEVGGGIVSGFAVPGGAAAQSGRLGVKTLTLADKAKTLAKEGMKVGAIQGGLTGAGSGEGAVDTVKKATIGTVAGGAGGGLIAPAAGIGGEKVVRAATAGYNKVRNMSAGLRGGEAAVDAAAERIIGQAHFADGYNPVGGMSAPQAAYARSAGAPVVNIERGGPEIRSRARAAASLNPEAKENARQVLTDRFEQQSERAAETLRAQSVLGGQAGRTEQELDDIRRRVLDKEYRKFEADANSLHPSGIWDSTLQRMTGSPVVQDAIRDVVLQARSRAVNENPFGIQIEKLFTKSPDGGLVLANPHVRPDGAFWDLVKRSLDRRGKNPNAPMAYEARGASTELRLHMDKLVPSYAKTRGIAAEFMDANDAIEAGQKMALNASMDTSRVRKLWNDMSNPERALFVEGWITAKVTAIEGLPDKSQVVGKVLGSKLERDRARIFLGEDGNRALEALVFREKIMDSIRQHLNLGSQTAEKSFEIKRFVDDVLPSALTGSSAAGGAWLYSGDPTTAGVAGTAAVGVSGAAHHKAMARIAPKIMEKLLSDDPQMYARAIKSIQENRQQYEALLWAWNRVAATVASRTGEFIANHPRDERQQTYE